MIGRRCQQLSNGAMVPAVQDSWSLQAGPQGRLPLIPPEQLKEELAGIRSSRALVVMLVDLLDCSGSFVGKIRDIVGKNPIVLVGTKVSSGRLCPVNRTSQLMSSRIWKDLLAHDMPPLESSNRGLALHAMSSTKHASINQLFSEDKQSQKDLALRLKKRSYKCYPKAAAILYCRWIYFPKEQTLTMSPAGSMIWPLGGR